MILGAVTQRPWLAMVLTFGAALGMTLLAYAFWRERGPRSWYAEDNHLLRYLGRNAVVLAVAFYLITLFGSTLTIQRQHTTNAWLFTAVVVTAVLWGLSMVLVFSMWFTGKPQKLVPPAFRRPLA